MSEKTNARSRNRRGEGARLRDELIAAAGTILLTEAYRRAPASIVASFEYSALIWVPLWGFLFFGEIPASATVAGGGLIVLAGLVALAAGRR